MNAQNLLANPVKTDDYGKSNSISSRCSDAQQLDVTRSTIGSQCFRRSQHPSNMSEIGNATLSSRCCVAKGIEVFAPKSDINVGILMRPETGAWANRTSFFAVPVKPLGLQRNQAPLVTAQQDAFWHKLKTNRLHNIRKAQEQVLGAHHAPNASVAVTAAPKGRRIFCTSSSCSVRDCLSKDGRSPIPKVRLPAEECDRPLPAAVSFLGIQGLISAKPAVNLKSWSPENSRRCHTSNKKDRSCAGGAITVDVELAHKFL